MRDVSYKYAGSKVPNRLTNRMTSAESLKPSPKMNGPKQPVEMLREYKSDKRDVTVSQRTHT